MKLDKTGNIEGLDIIGKNWKNHTNKIRKSWKWKM